VTSDPSNRGSKTVAKWGGNKKKMGWVMKEGKFFVRSLGGRSKQSRNRVDTETEGSTDEVGEYDERKEEKKGE